MSLRIFLSIALLTTSSTAWAVPQCPTDDHFAELSRFEERLRGADSVEEAQELALKKVGASKDAVDRAARLVPGDDELLAHQSQLQQLVDGVAQADSPDAVAEQFAGFHAQRMGGGCSFSTGEVIAIVLGFILGIIPGIILLILLC